MPAPKKRREQMGLKVNMIYILRVKKDGFGEHSEIIKEVGNAHHTQSLPRSQ